MIAAAVAEIGTLENPAGSNRTPYGAAYGLQGEPWCAVFIWYCMVNSGNANLLPKTAYVPSLVQWARAAGRVVTDPQPGDLACYDWPPADGVADHVGVVESATSSTVVCIEGNTTPPNSSGDQGAGGGVWRRERSRSLVQAFIRPPYQEAAVPIDANDAALIARTEEGYYTVTTPDGRKETLHPAISDLLAYSAGNSAALARIEAALKAPVNVTVDVQALASAVAAKIPAGSTIDPAALATAVADELANRLKA